MARSALTFRQRRLTCALRATRKAGFEVQRIEIDKDDKIVIVTCKPKEEIQNAETPEALRELL